MSKTMQLDIEPFIRWVVVVHHPESAQAYDTVRYEDALLIRDDAREAHPNAVITIAAIHYREVPCSPLL